MALSRAGPGTQPGSLASVEVPPSHPVHTLPEAQGRNDHGAQRTAQSEAQVLCAGPAAASPGEGPLLLTPLPGGSHAVRAARRLQTLREPPAPTLSSVSWTHLAPKQRSVPCDSHERHQTPQGGTPAGLRRWQPVLPCPPGSPAPPVGPPWEQHLPACFLWQRRGPLGAHRTPPLSAGPGPRCVCSVSAQHPARTTTGGASFSSTCPCAPERAGGNTAYTQERCKHTCPHGCQTPCRHTRPRTEASFPHPPRGARQITILGRKRPGRETSGEKLIWDTST